MPINDQLKKSSKIDRFDSAKNTILRISAAILNFGRHLGFEAKFEVA